MNKIDKITFYLTTASQCLIGNHTQSFSIGGIDQCTTMDETNQFPVIQASAFKGSFRSLVRQEQKKESAIVRFYTLYLKGLSQEVADWGNRESKEQIEDGNKARNQALEMMQKRIESYKENVQADYIFGIEGINKLPRIYFSDSQVFEKDKMKNYFATDTKTSITAEANEIISNPRSYRPVRKGIRFSGEIIFCDFASGLAKELLEENSGLGVSIREEIKGYLEKYNQHYYRIGNSKSRGYGIIDIEIRD